MNTKMSRWGIGPKFFLISLAYLVPTLLLTRMLHPFSTIPLLSHRILIASGIVVLCTGLTFYFFAVPTVMRAYNEGKLVTTGPFSVCRHPVYASWAVFIVPGIMLMLNCWIGLTYAPVMCLVLKTLAREEEIFLEKTYGDKYRAYKSKISSILPLGSLLSK